MQGSSEASGPGSGGSKPGLAGLMRRAVQQAKAEAAAAAAKSQTAPLVDKQLAPVSAQLSMTQPAGGDKRSLAAMLTKVAQKMQEQEAATSSDSASTSLPRTATTQAGSDLLQAKLLVPDSEVSKEESNTQDEPVDPDNLQLSSVNRASSSNSVERLLREEPKRPPSRSQSLGERLGAILRGALSIPRQSSYAPIAEDDPRPPNDSALFDLLPPVRRRALPRDASYLPEWLNQTFSISPGGRDQNETDLALDTEELLQEPVDDDTDLPQWVDWSTIQPKEKPPVMRRPAPLTVPTDESSIALLLTDPQPVAQLTVPTPKGQRLFEFWRQKSAAARSTSAVEQGMGPSLPPLSSGHTQASAFPQIAQRDAPVSNSGQEVASSDGINLRQLQAQMRSDNESPADTLEQPQVHQQPLQPSTSTAKLAAELAATSHLVHQQSLQQAELLQGLEHALSELSQHRLLIQNPIPQPEASQEVAPEGKMLAPSLSSLW